MKSNAAHMMALVAENISIAMTFALSRSSLDAFKNANDLDFYPLQRLLDQIPEERADRALLEMAYLLRSLDDSEGISQEFDGSFGELHLANGNTAELGVREVMNKIIHSSRYIWHAADLGTLRVEW